MPTTCRRGQGEAKDYEDFVPVPPLFLLGTAKGSRSGRPRPIQEEMPSVSQPPNPAGDERAARVVRAAIRAYLDGVTASDWLVSPNAALDGRSPLSVAKESEEGCARVCAALEAARSAASPG